MKTVQEILKLAQGEMGDQCKACPVCDGRACRNRMPGPGAKGIGDVAIRNYDAWQKIRVNMDTLVAKGAIDTTFRVFGTRMIVASPRHSTEPSMPLSEYSA